MVLSFQEIMAIEEAGHRGVSSDRGDSGCNGGSEAGWGGVGGAPHNGAPQFVRVQELRPMVISGEGV